MQSNRLIDYARPNEAATDAFLRLAEYGTALALLPVEEAWARYEATFKSEPEEISSERFMEMLGVLPPSFGSWCCFRPSL
jgi:hypothetical protein